MANYIETGIQGLDKILKGGIVEKNCVLFTGIPGAGKTLAAMQMAYNAASKGIPTLFLSSEEPAKDIRERLLTFGFDTKQLEKDNLLTIKDVSTSGRMVTLNIPMQVIAKKKIKFLALDSLTLFKYVYSYEPAEFRRGIISFLTEMKKLGVTVITTSERTARSLDSFEYKEEDFLFDGIILFSMLRKGSNFERIMQVLKMRNQDHSLDVFPLAIGKKGIEIYPKELPFSLIEADCKK